MRLLSEKLSEKFSAKLSEKLVENASEKLSEKLSGTFSQKLSENASEKLPRKLSTLNTARKRCYLQHFRAARQSSKFVDHSGRSSGRGSVGSVRKESLT